MTCDCVLLSRMVGDEGVLVVCSDQMTIDCKLLNRMAVVE